MLLKVTLQRHVASYVSSTPEQAFDCIRAEDSLKNRVNSRNEHRMLGQEIGVLKCSRESNFLVKENPHYAQSCLELSSNRTESKAARCQKTTRDICSTTPV